MTLPINLDDLIHARQVESARIEFKKSWEKPIKDAVARTICAFANDFFNFNGGYIILGIEEQQGKPLLPPCGLESHDLDKVQKEIRGIGNRLDPQYPPITSPETYQGKQILVIWVPGGDLRPYQAPETLDKGSKRKYYLRQGSETIEAKGVLLTQLMQLTARVPFDDRRNLTASLDVISPTLVRNFLADINSDLVAPGVTHPDQYLLNALKITTPVNSHEAPRNVALLFFVDDPEQYFPGTRIEIAQFRDEAGGDLIEEQIFRGPIQSQIRQALTYLNSLSTSMVKKVPNQAIANRTVAFPYEAMEEALVNAVYHRSYEGNPEPTKIYLYPDRLEIISYPGPVPGITHQDFQPGARSPKAPCRNRRVGDFLKELKLAEARGTGIPKIRRRMTENGSPEPIFEFDEPTRTYFCVTLPAHPQYIVIHALREAAHLWAIGERQRAIAHLETSRKRVPTSGALIAQTIEYRVANGDLALAEQLFRQIESDLTLQNRHLPYSAMAKSFLDQGEVEKAKRILEKSPQPLKENESLELAILYKRASDFQSAHRLLKENYDFVENEPKFLHEYAQVKNTLARKTRDKRARNRLNREAQELLRRVIQLSPSDPVRRAWCWFDLARTLTWLESPRTEIDQAYTEAIRLLPDEPQFQDAYTQWQHQWEAE